jgi:hypothetical protein
MTCRAPEKNGVCLRQAFKATAKGKGRLGSSAVGDIWLHCLFFALLAASIGVGAWQLAARDAVVSTLLVSVLWAGYAIIPPFLLICYAALGPGLLLAAVCKLCLLASFGAGLATLVVLWLVPSYESHEGAGLLFRYIHQLQASASQALAQG